MFNEEEVLPLLVERLRPVADAWGVSYEVLCVDDGSTDTTPVLLQRVRRTWDAAAGGPAAGQLRAPGGDLRRAGPGARPVGGHDRRRPAGPARGHRGDARGGPGPGGRRRLRGAGGPLERLGVQAGHGAGVLPLDPAPVRRRRPRRRRGLPPDVARHGRRRQRAARAPPRPAPRRPGAGVPQRVGGLPARAARGRGLQVPPGQDAAPLGRRGHRVLHRSAAVRDVAGAARRSGRRHRPALRAGRHAHGEHAARLDVDGRHRLGGGGGAAARPGHPRGVRGAHLHGAAGAAVVLRRARLGRPGRPGRQRRPGPRGRPGRRRQPGPRARPRSWPRLPWRRSGRSLRPGPDRRPRRPTWSW